MENMQNSRLQHLTEEHTYIFNDLQRAIKANQKKQFDKAMKKYKELLKGKLEKNWLHFTVKGNSNKELFIDLFRNSLKNYNKYYRNQLFELKSRFLFSNESTDLLRIAIQENDVEIARKCVVDGANLTEFDSLCTTPLEDAIRCKNLEMICMLLYYGGYTNNMENNLTSFMFSIICQCSEDIQRILMEYETDYNLCCDNDSTLFMALKYHSPLIFDLIERGADPNFTKPSYHGTIIAPLEAIRSKCNVEIVKKLWSIFDYNVWINYTTGTTPSSVLCRFLKILGFYSFQEDTEQMEYLQVFLENEEKLKLDIQHHENVECTSLIHEFYRRCVDQQLFDEKLIQNFVFHLLSYGAVIYTADIDRLYSLSFDKESRFFEDLLFMDLHEETSRAKIVTFMYFKYTPRPNINEFLIKLLESYKIRRDASKLMDVLDAINKLSELFAFKYDIKKNYQDFFIENKSMMSSLTHVKGFPSLLQLSRDASRIALCDCYSIQSARQFYDILNSLNIPNVIKELLTYRQRIYRVS